MPVATDRPFLNGTVGFFIPVANGMPFLVGTGGFLMPGATGRPFPIGKGGYPYFFTSERELPHIGLKRNCKAVFFLHDFCLMFQ
jgi:hypothetical protein